MDIKYSLLKMKMIFFCPTVYAQVYSPPSVLRKNPTVMLLRNNVNDLDRKKIIITVIDITFAVVKRKPVKNQACTGFEPMTSAIPVQRSNQLS